MAKVSLFLYLCLVIAACSSIQALALEDSAIKPEGRTKFDDDLRDFVEFLKLQMQCGYPAAGVPPLAPYQADFKEFNIQGSSFSFKGNMSDLVVTGLNEFDVIDLNWNNVFQKITYDFKFPSIQAHSSYKLNAITSTFGSSVGFYGNGLFNLELINLRASGSFKLRPSLSGGLTMWGFKVQLDLESSKSKTTGIMNSFIYTKLFNSWVEEFINLTFGEGEAVSEAVEYLVVPPMNKALKNISMIELVALIMGLAKDVVPSDAVC